MEAIVASARPYMSSDMQAIINNPQFRSVAAKSAVQFLHKMMILKGLITVVVLVAAISVSARYSMVHNPAAKKKILYYTDLWVGRQSGIISMLVILWLPTLIFLIGMRFVK